MIRLLKESDRKIIENYLERNHLETTYLIGNIEFGIDNNKEVRRCADYFGYFEEDKLKGIIPFYNLGSCIPHYESKGAVPHFVDLIKEKDVSVLIGMSSIIKPLYDEIKGYKNIKNYSESCYLINNELKAVNIDGAIYKDIRGSKDEDILQFVIRARKEGFNFDIDRETLIKSLKDSGPEDDYILMIKDNKMVALACVQTATSKINQIGGVITVIEERGKGYCKAVVSELTRRIIARNKIPTLWVKKDNIPAYRAYKALGYEDYDEYLMIEF